jgi:hypothetical protein
VISDESNELAWVALEDILNLAPDLSIRRMVEKSLALLLT